MAEDPSRGSTYRDRPPEAPPRIVEHGPFPRRWREAVVGLVGATLTLGFALFSLGADRLTCERATDTCVLSRTGLVGTGDRLRFPLSAVSEVRWVPTTSKGTARGHTDLVWRDGSQRSIFATPRDEAAKLHQQIAAFVADPARPSVVVAEETSWVGALFFGAAALVLLLGGTSPLRHPSSIQVLVRPGDVEVVRRWFGVSLRRARIDRCGARDVTVDRGGFRTFFMRARQPSAPAARLVLRGSAEVPLTNRYLPGHDVHDRAANALRAALRDEPEPAPSAARPATPSSAAPIAPSAPAPSIGRRRWLLVGGTIVAIAGVLGVQLVFEASARRTQGTLDVTCRQRCRYGGAECLPGGAWRASVDPGQYTIDVFDPDSPSRWRPVTATVRLGETTHFVCEPLPPGR